MKTNFDTLMSQATRLTRGGDLRAATAAIQQAIGLPTTAAFPGVAAPAPAPASPKVPDVIDVIDIDARVVPDSSADNPAPAPGATAEAPAEARAHACDEARDPARAAVHGADAPFAPFTAPASAEGFRAGRHTEASRHLDYKLYVPPNAGAARLPLVVMLHGCTQDPDDFAAGTAMNEAARARGFFVLYPAQSQQANPQRCWNWFKHNHQGRGRGEPAVIAGLTRSVMAQHAIDPARVYVAGLSAGGAMAAIVGEAYPELFAAVGVHSGLAAGAAGDLPTALAAMQGQAGAKRSGAPSMVPTIVFHGDADATVHPRNGAQVVAASAGSGAAGTVQRDRPANGAGRAVTREVHRGADHRVVAEHWVVHGLPHAWSGGSARGSYTDPQGPSATAEMLRFFFEHPGPGAG